MTFRDYSRDPSARDDYSRQRELEQYQLTRPLAVPKTRIIHIILFGLLLIVTAAVPAVLCLIFQMDRWASIGCITAFSVLVFETYFRFFCIKLIECYQHYASEERRRRCLCIPSCSEYAIRCLKKYETAYALIRIRKRLFVTCRGDSYIVDEP